MVSFAFLFKGTCWVVTGLSNKCSKQQYTCKNRISSPLPPSAAVLQSCNPSLSLNLPNTYSCTWGSSLSSAKYLLPSHCTICKKLAQIGHLSVKPFWKDRWSCLECKQTFTQSAEGFLRIWLAVDACWCFFPFKHTNTSCILWNPVRFIWEKTKPKSPEVVWTCHNKVESLPSVHYIFRRVQLEGIQKKRQDFSSLSQLKTSP